MRWSQARIPRSSVCHWTWCSIPFGSCLESPSHNYFDFDSLSTNQSLDVSLRHYNFTTYRIVDRGQFQMSSCPLVNCNFTPNNPVSREIPHFHRPTQGPVILNNKSIILSISGGFLSNLSCSLNAVSGSFLLCFRDLDIIFSINASQDCWSLIWKC